MRSVLIIVPFNEIYPPMNGGTQRFFHIMHQLSKHFKLTAVIHQDKESFLECVKSYPAMATANIYSTQDVAVKDIFNLATPKWEKALRSRWYQRKWNRPADGSLVKYYPIISRLLKSQHFDAIVLENLATLNAVNIIRRYDRQVPIIYNAHNVDSNLAKAAMAREEITSAQLQRYIDTESNLYKKVDAVMVCSEDDRNILVKMNDNKLPIAVIPNGVGISARKYDAGVLDENCRNIIFCGALWSIPNAEAIDWFCKKIWPLVATQYPTLKLLVVGSGELPAKYAGIKGIKNIEFIGPVSDVKPWYNQSAISVVPLLTGSGTRLKVLEAMGLGVPVVSTAIGAEGIEYTSEENILIADDEKEFAAQIRMLLENKKCRSNMAINARALVEKKYDWDVIGEQMKKKLIPIK